MNLSKKVYPLVAGLAVWAHTSVAFAQEVQVDNFEPLQNQRANVLNTASSEVLGHLDPSLGIFFDYLDDPLQVVNATTGEVDSKVIDHRLTSNLSIGIGLLDRLELGLSVPVILSQTGDVQTLTGEEGRRTFFGDYRVRTKLRLIERDAAGGFGLALAHTLSLPTGASGTFSTDGRVRYEPQAILDYRSGGFIIAANLGYAFRPRRVIMNYVNDDMIRYRVGAEIPLKERLSLVGSVFGNGSVERFRKNARETVANNPLEALAGVKFYTRNGVILQAGGGTGFRSSLGDGDFRAYAGLAYAPQAPETEPTPPATKPEPPRDDKVTPEEPPEKKPTPRVVVTKTHIVVRGKVHFDTDKAVIKPQSYSILEEVAQALRDNPQITKVRVEGHTDHRASEDYNQRLSERRAKAVVRFLVKREGIDPSRLSSIGYGESRPVASNETEEGMARNRRVEFRIIEVDGETVNPTEEIVTETKEKEVSQ